MLAIVIHGGAGRIEAGTHAAALAGVAGAADRGWQVLAAGGSALDAVAAAVVALEDDPAFNAGTGSVLNLEGEAEMDAGIMAGDTLAAGGVACIMRVRNPVIVARRVMDTTDCVLLAGSEATAFARQQGFADHDPVSARRRAQWRAALQPGAARDGMPGGGTVGAVALDRDGRMAAATSTGGRELKRPGRVGDSAIPGAGNYANSHAAVSATGWGELMLRFVTAKDIAERIGRGEGAQRSVQAVLDAMQRRFGAGIGAIALDHIGGIGIAHGTQTMPHAYRRTGDAAVTARIAVQD